MRASTRRSVRGRRRVTTLFDDINSAIRTEQTVRAVGIFLIGFALSFGVSPG